MITSNQKASIQKKKKKKNQEKWKIHLWNGKNILNLYS
jgi:hypothetical protein